MKGFELLDITQEKDMMFLWTEHIDGYIWQWQKSTKCLDIEGH